MTKKSSLIMILIFVFLLVSCSGSNADSPTDAVESQTPPAVMADTFFSGYAVLDENENGIKDADEPLLGG